MQIPTKPLDVKGVTLRYRPLPALDVADYAEKHMQLLETSGTFDSLAYGAAELRIRADAIDLAGLAALGKALATMLTKSVSDAGKLRALIIEHCNTFTVEIEHEGAWIKLDSADAINAHLDFEQCFDVVAALAGGVLRPFWNRLRSRAEENRKKSAKPSTETSPAS